MFRRLLALSVLFCAAAAAKLTADHQKATGADPGPDPVAQWKLCDVFNCQFFRGLLGRVAQSSPQLVRSLFAGPEQACSQGFEAFNDHCYKLVKEAKNWTNADAHCRAIGAKLADLKREEHEELMFVKYQMLAPQGYLGDSHVWVGGYSDYWYKSHKRLGENDPYVPGTSLFALPTRRPSDQELCQYKKIYNYTCRRMDGHGYFFCNYCREPLAFICKK